MATIARARDGPRARARRASTTGTRRDWANFGRSMPERAGSRRANAVLARASSAGDGSSASASRDVVVFSYDAVIDATMEMTRVAHDVASERWGRDVIVGDCASYVEAMRQMRRCIPESTSCEGVVMLRVIADEAIIGARTTSGGRPGPVFSAEQRFERRTRPLTVDEVVSSWPEIKLMSVLKWGEEVESTVGWDGRKMMPAGLQDAVDKVRVSDQRKGEQFVYEDLKPLIRSALQRGSTVYVMNSRGRPIEACRDVLRENGFSVLEDDDGVGIRVVNVENFASRSLAAANLIATTARPGEHWHVIDGDIDELERFNDADFGDEYASLTEGVTVTLRLAGYAYASPKAIHRASLSRNISSLTAASAKTLALNFLGDFASVTPTTNL